MLCGSSSTLLLHYLLLQWHLAAGDQIPGLLHTGNVGLKNFIISGQ